VSVILPTRDRLDLLRPCVEGLFATNSGDFEVIILDNDSARPETLAWFEEALGRWDRLRVLAAPGPFNWSRLNNIGVAAADGDVFVFLNNDTLPRSDEWLARLADVAMRPDAGAVGALLLYGNGRIQHAGVVIGYGGCSDHVYRGAPLDSDEHMFVSPHLPRNVAAVTGACMAISRRTLQAIGPFDEAYPVAGNDVEICVRAMVKGYLNIYLPDVVLVHLESQTRGRRDPAADVERLEAFLAENCPEDPYYNPNLWMSSLYPSIPLWGERAARPR
jgi:GT2 family glycosyltransferase